MEMILQNDIQESDTDGSIFNHNINYIKKDMLLVLSKEGEDYIQFKQVIIYWYFYLTNLFMEFNSSKLNFKNINFFF